MEDHFRIETKGLKILIHASAWFAPILVPLLVFFLVRDGEVKSLSIQAILFHVFLWAAMAVSWVLVFIIVGIPLLIGFVAVGIAVPVMGIINAAQDRYFEYPMIGSWLK